MITLKNIRENKDSICVGLLKKKYDVTKIDDLLAASNSSKADLVKVTILMADIDYYSKINEIYGEWLGDTIPPARAAYSPAKLPLGALVEIVCEAVRNSGDYRTDLPAELEEALI